LSIKDILQGLTLAQNATLTFIESQCKVLIYLSTVGV
jgi:hypothetical protein